MEKNTRTKNILLIVLLVAVLTLSVAYALLSQTLTITSQATVGGKNNTWKVLFTAASCTPSGKATKEADFSLTNSTSISGLAATLRAPGDSIVCQITVSNQGAIDATLDTFTLNAGTFAYKTTGGQDAPAGDVTKATGLLNYSIVYATNDSDTASRGLQPKAQGTNNDLMAPTGSASSVDRHLTLTISLPSTVTEADLPAGDVVITGFESTFLYKQKTA